MTKTILMIRYFIIFSYFFLPSTYAFSNTVEALLGELSIEEKQEIISELQQGTSTLYQEQQNDLRQAEEKPLAPITEPLDLTAENSLQLFAQDLIQSVGTQSTIVSPPSSQYVVNEGDEFLLYYFGRESQVFELIVDNSGYLLIPELQRLPVAGLSLRQVKEMVSQKVTEALPGISPELVLQQYGSLAINILGYVNQPGNYVISNQTTLFSALALAGGITSGGSYRDIILKRNNETLKIFDLYEFYQSIPDDLNLTLQSGDTIFVSPHEGTVDIQGAVELPARFQLHKKTVNRLGDYLKLAVPQLGVNAMNAAKVLRTNSKGFQDSLTLDSKDIANFLLKPGDRVELLESSVQTTNAIYLQGNFQNTGLMDIADLTSLNDIFDQPDTRTTDDLLDQYLFFLIPRQQPNLEKPRRVTVVSGEQVMNNTVPDILIYPQDMIVALAPFSQFTFRASDWEFLGEEISSSTIHEQLTLYLSNQQKLSFLDSQHNSLNVSGDIQFPGLYPMMNNLSLPMLILLAGGPLPGKSWETIELVTWQPELKNKILHRENWTSDLLQQIDLQEVNEIFFRAHQGSYQSSHPIVSIAGQVQFPGEYRLPIGAGIQEALAAAGGLTQMADLDGAIILQAKLASQNQSFLQSSRQQLIELLVNQSTQVDIVEEGYDLNEIGMIDRLLNLPDQEFLGRVVVDVPSLLATEQGDILLEEGDQIIIPKYSETISIVGEIFQTSNFSFDPSISFQEYVQQAGGFTNQADSKNITIIGKNGKSRKLTFSSWQLPLEAGDTVIVPRKLIKVSGLRYWESITSIMFQSAVTLAALRSL